MPPSHAIDVRMRWPQPRRAPVWKPRVARGEGSFLMPGASAWPRRRKAVGVDVEGGGASVSRGLAVHPPLEQLFFFDEYS